MEIQGTEKHIKLHTPQGYFQQNIYCGETMNKLPSFFNKLQGKKKRGNEERTYRLNRLIQYINQSQNMGSDSSKVKNKTLVVFIRQLEI
jgi:hypothetical protein